MNFTKKILAIILSAVLAISLFSVCASAAGTPSGNESMAVTVTTDSETYGPGENVTVSVSIKCNYNATTFRFPIVYDSSVLEAPVLIGLTGCNTCATGSLNSNTDGDQFIPDAYDASAFNCVLVQWTADVSNGTIGCLNSPDGEVCFTFNLKTKTSAAGMTGSIFIPSESDLFYYQAMNDPTDATTIYYLNAASCPIAFNGANVTVIGDSAKIVANDGYESQMVIDNVNNRINGFPTGIASTTDVKTYVKATGEGTISVTPTENGYGTGTKVNLRISGSVIKTYAIIIFGDYNSNAEIDAADLITNFSVLQSITDLTDPNLAFAGDLSGDGTVDATDMVIMFSVIQGLNSIDQTHPY